MSDNKKKPGRNKVRRPRSPPPRNKENNRARGRPAHALPSKPELLNHLLSRQGPAGLSRICRELGVLRPEAIEKVKARLEELHRAGELVITRRGDYAASEKFDLIRGQVQGHSSGWGYLLPTGGGERLSIAPRQMREVFDGDLALGRIIGVDNREQPLVHLIEVVERNTRHLVGRLQREGDFSFVVPDNPRITQDILLEGDLQSARPGQVVEVEILEQPSRQGRPRGRVSSVLGDYMAPGMEIQRAIRNHDIPTEWNPALEAECDQLPRRIAGDELSRRLDLRDKAFVTIDGEDSRDFDDAVYCEDGAEGSSILQVAIADVSFFVHPGSALDREAEHRGTSVYFPDRVVPMFPEALSEDLCSLRPDCDRLALVCTMNIDHRGRLDGFRFAEAVICSQARLTYTELGPWLEDTESKAAQDFAAEHGELLEPLGRLAEVYKRLLGARRQRGAIEFESDELRVVFNDDGKIDQLLPVERNHAHRLIEECMLAANVATARFVKSLQIPSLYRVHETPSKDKVTELKYLLQAIGIKAPFGTDPKPEQFAQLLTRMAEDPRARILSDLMLRAMPQAVYQPGNLGHFGLACSAYSHFTSPIRRYPDLLVHRALRSVIQSHRDTELVERAPNTLQRPVGENYPYDFKRLVSLGEHCSMAERRADAATREVMKWLKCEFMREHLGEEFEGRISGVTGFGLFVTIEKFAIDGLIHIRSLPNDYYHFDPKGLTLSGERSNLRFHFGDRLQVQVSQINLDDSRIDLKYLP